MRANIGQPQEVVEYERLHPDRPGPGSCTGRVAMTKKPVHIPDVTADPEYSYPAVELRTLLGLPVLFEDALVGVIGLARNEVRPFEDGEIALMAAFADQSAIAIANAKLFETVEQQRVELSRFLSPEVAALVSSVEGAQLLAGHRAYITVVYFDLRGFTAFTETAEPEELIDVVREYHAVTGELVNSFGGTLEHFAGDGLMVFFNDPVPVSEHELQAAKLAVAMRERIGELAVGWRKRGYELGLGAGIAVGHATLGPDRVRGTLRLRRPWQRDQPRRAAQRRSGIESDPIEPTRLRGARGTGRGQTRRPVADERLRPPGTGLRAPAHQRRLATRWLAGGSACAVRPPDGR